MGNLLSSNSTPRLYEDITLLLAYPELDFPDEFDPQRPYKVKELKMISRGTFCTRVKNENGVAVVELEDFDPRRAKEQAPEEVALRDGATYIVVPRQQHESTEKRVSSSGDERMLTAVAMKELKKTQHTNVRAWCQKKLTGPNGWYREVDAVALADNCAIVVEHKNILDKSAALQLYSLIADIDAFKNCGKGTVADFSGMRIIGALAGPVETTDPNNKRAMDEIIDKNKFFKWFEKKDYGDCLCSPFPASGASFDNECDAPNPTTSPTNGPTAPAALASRGGRLLTPMRGSVMLVRPRLASSRVGGWRLSF